MSAAYTTLEKVFKKLYDLEGAKAILHWDSAVMMPAGGAEARAEQLATLTSIHHAILTDPDIGDLISESEADSNHLNEWQRANVREIRRVFRHANAVDGALVKRLSLAGSKCEHVWRDARKNNDFAAYAPLQQEVLELVREVAKAKAEAFGCSPYDALLDQYDPGRTSAQIDPIFDDLKAFLPGFIDEALAHQEKKPALQALKGPFAIDKQRELGELCMKAVGFDCTYGRLDVSHHPFCGGIPGDVRITTRYDEANFGQALMGVLHETGHAMYENGLPKGWREQPVGAARGMAVHESQSLIIEMQAGRSREFMEFLQPLICKIFNKRAKAWEVENLYAHFTRVERSFIRVDADEVTYPAHVLLRYYLERYMIAGELEIKDLPDAWNEGMQKFLGITPKNFYEGCMQDIHWTDGTFGYFPNYTLGAMTAAQLFAAAKNADNALLPALRQGDFRPLMDWLRTNIHSQGSLLSSAELIEKATGKPLGTEDFKRHLRARYVE